MAINKNHEFEEINGIKCSIVERNATAERVQFLKELLEFNNYTVVVAPTPIKAAPPKAADPAVQGEQPAPIEPPAPPETFTIGVTHLAFNPVNAIFGRLLQTSGGHIVTLNYWQQKEDISNDEIPYYE